MHPIETVRHTLETEHAAASAALRAVPGIGSGAMGLTPDAVKFSPEYREKKAAHVRAFAVLQAFNKANPPPRRSRCNP